MKRAVGGRSQVFQASGSIAFDCTSIKRRACVYVKTQMGLIRLRIRELAAQRGWTIKEVALRSGLPYSSVKTYTQREAMSTTDYTSIYKLARAFGVAIEDLVEILEE